MTTLRLADIATFTHGRRLIGADGGERVHRHARCVAASLRCPGGESHDAHAFVAQALVAPPPRPWSADGSRLICRRSWCATRCCAGRPRQRRTPRPAPCPRGRHHRLNGKTTVKTLAAAVLQRTVITHVTVGNLNNEIGLPLTVLALPEDAEFAVLEMGAGKPGDIAYRRHRPGPRSASSTTSGRRIWSAWAA